MKERYNQKIEQDEIISSPVFMNIKLRAKTNMRKDIKNYSGISGRRLFDFLYGS